ncbi:cytochrome P450 [Streptomyces sp. NPDC023723]|uniref:cytochrome P450 n=1 Tax=Streptomyces sp. NPDC023723 TaxID=3154323 RepID=UPI0033C3AED1
MPDPTEPVAFPQDRTCPYRPPAGYDRLRAARPLARVTLYDGRPAWLVTGHATARRLLADQRLSTDRTRPGFPATSARLAGTAARRSALLGVDDPEHRAQRHQVLPEFTLRRAADLRPRIQRIVDEHLDALTAQGPPADLVSAFALPVPSRVICALLGVPYADHDFFQEQSRRLLRGPTAADALAARDRLAKYLGDLVDLMARRPADAGGTGLLHALVHRPGRDAPGRDDLVALAIILLVAGHETTADMISLGTYTLLRHPERLAELRADPALLPGAVEELMRTLAITDGLLRLAVADIETDGETIRAGDGVVFALSLINRDPALRPDPDSLDWHRPARLHLSFGSGIHQCLGQHLARAELEIALGTLVRRFPALRLAAPAARLRWKPGDTIQGMLELPVAW